MMNKNKSKVGIVGLGYVGLPLALEFSKKIKIIAYDKSKERIFNLKKGIDKNNELSKEAILFSKKIKFTNNKKDLKVCNIFIITVPTPINSKNLPDLKLLKKACEIVGKYLKKDSVFILESTVYPGCTEEFCVPILEKISKLKFNKDFFCGYSPERINPGDKKHSIKKITKIVSGSNLNAKEKIKDLYKLVTKKIHVAKTIKIAESAKVIENIQRDLNIALVNEISIILKKMKIETKEVLKAASTKWNFIKFSPGLVGGHCIGVDPYYFTYKARKLNYNPKVILAGRSINNYMTRFVTNEIKLLISKFFDKKRIKILILGFTYKENISDVRNSQIIKIINMIKSSLLNIYVFDPHVDKNFKFNDKKIKILKNLNKKNFYDFVFIGTPHKKIIKLGGKKIKSFCKKKSLIYDLKSSIDNKYTDSSLC